MSSRRSKRIRRPPPGWFLNLAFVFPTSNLLLQPRSEVSCIPGAVQPNIARSFASSAMRRARKCDDQTCASYGPAHTLECATAGRRSFPIWQHPGFNNARLPMPLIVMPNAARPRVDWRIVCCHRRHRRSHLLRPGSAMPPWNRHSATATPQPDARSFCHDFSVKCGRLGSLVATIRFGLWCARRRRSPMLRPAPGNGGVVCRRRPAGGKPAVIGLARSVLQRDFDAPVARAAFGRCVRSDRICSAAANGNEGARFKPMIPEVARHGVGTALRQPEIVCIRPDRVRIAGDGDSRNGSVAQVAQQLVERLARVRPECRLPGCEVGVTGKIHVFDGSGCWRYRHRSDRHWGRHCGNRRRAALEYERGRRSVGAE